MDIFAQLAAPFPADRVSWRVGSTTADKKKGMALAFIDARDVMDRLDQVCGPAGWQCSYPHANGKTVCRIEIKIDGEWIGKEDGAGDTDVEAEKGALSDAFKRSAVRWGVGRYLYDLDSPWVEIEPAGRSFKIKESERRAKLEPLLRRDAQRSAAQAPAVAPEQPADAVSPQIRAAYVAECRKKIDGFQTVDDMLTWWNGDLRKGQFHQFDLSADESAELKSAVVARRAAITKQAA